MRSKYLLAPKVNGIHGMLLCGGNHLIHHQYTFSFICKIIPTSIPDAKFGLVATSVTTSQPVSWQDGAVRVFIDAAEWGVKCWNGACNSNRRGCSVNQDGDPPAMLHTPRLMLKGLVLCPYSSLCFSGRLLCCRRPSTTMHLLQHFWLWSLFVSNRKNSLVLVTL